MFRVLVLQCLEVLNVFHLQSITCESVAWRERERERGGGGGGEVLLRKCSHILCRPVKISISNLIKIKNEKSRGCISGAVSVPCVYTHAM